MQRRTFFKAMAGVAASLAAIYGERFKVAELHLTSTDDVKNLNAGMFEPTQEVKDFARKRGLSQAGWSRFKDPMTGDPLFIPYWS